MKDILVAFGRAGRSLGRRDIFWHLLWPGLLSMVIWAGVAFYAWTPVTEWLYATVSGWSFIGGWLSASETTAAIALVPRRNEVALTPEGHTVRKGYAFRLTISSERVNAWDASETFFFASRSRLRPPARPGA